MKGDVAVALSRITGARVTASMLDDAALNFNFGSARDATASTAAAATITTTAARVAASSDQPSSSSSNFNSIGDEQTIHRRGAGRAVAPTAAVNDASTAHNRSNTAAPTDAVDGGSVTRIRNYTDADDGGSVTRSRSPSSVSASTTQLQLDSSGANFNLVGVSNVPRPAPLPRLGAGGNGTANFNFSGGVEGGTAAGAVGRSSRSNSLVETHSARTYLIDTTSAAAGRHSNHSLIDPRSSAMPPSSSSSSSSSRRTELPTSFDPRSSADSRRAGSMGAPLQLGSSGMRGSAVQQAWRPAGSPKRADKPVQHSLY